MKTAFVTLGIFAGTVFGYSFDGIAVTPGLLGQTLAISGGAAVIFSLAMRILRNFLDRRHYQ